MSRYHAPKGGLPAQTDIIDDRAVFKEICAVITQGKDLNRLEKLRGLGGLHQ